MRLMTGFSCHGIPGGLQVSRWTMEAISRITSPLAFCFLSCLFSTDPSQYPDMSTLPEYQRLPMTEDEAPPAWSKGARSPSLDETSYPPRSMVGSSTQPGTNVTYTFEPRWPIKGDPEDAVGVMGRDKNVSQSKSLFQIGHTHGQSFFVLKDTIAIVRRAFPILDEYSTDRIEFAIPVDKDAKDVRWSRVLDDAWPNFVNCPPSRLRVQIADRPGDAEASECFPTVL